MGGVILKRTMENFKDIAQFISRLPDWTALLLLPALLIVSALVFALVGRRKWYFFCAALFGGVGVFFVAVKWDASYAIGYLGAFTALTALFSLLLLIPSPRRKRGSKEERMYEKFHAELDKGPREPVKRPPKEVVGEEVEPPRVSAEESGFRLAHVTAMLERLRASTKLSAGDRLETDVLARTLDGYRSRELSPEELRALNDCLASILKLTAKYQL